ncbi:FAD-binding and (Fe-S)-binding domain-containing protein [Telmatospirillum sp. J64-1]|uniref:FAD-binding and (Fe-S)-binding domain-containing protein n=1 Tax=Telmatospirillum sp. J64-1 TaxID=2502183 RepID=UPI00115F17CC|nr:FAD-binding and (Fe-S)-binding domain-containing protein [Telmatospirillum sp. J64-1]
MARLPQPKPVSLSAEASQSLARDLARRVSGEVRFDTGARALYATDSSNYRQIPIGVVLPRTERDLIEAIAVCRDHGVPILARAGGTSLAGQSCNAAVILDCSKYFNRVLSVDPQKRLARVEPGCVLDSLRDEAQPHGLTFGPDPSTHSRCGLGGMIGNNSCGVHSIMAGRVADNVQSMEVLTYDGLRLRVGPTPEEELDRLIALGGRRGEIYAGLKHLRDSYAGLIRACYPKIPRLVSGYNLDALLPENGFNLARALVGSEGTCVTILSAEVNLIPRPPHRVLLVLGYPDVYHAGDHVLRILGFGPVGLEGMDAPLTEYMRRKNIHVEMLDALPRGKGWLLAEFGGDSPEEAEDKARACMDTLRRETDPPEMKLFEDPTEQEDIWTIREAGLGATAFVPGHPDTWEGWEDAAVPPARLGAYLRDFRTLLERYGYPCSLYGHFGDGCVHVRIPFDLTTQEGIGKYRRFTEQAADLVLKYGGSLSGEHGDGISRAELLPRMFGPELIKAFRDFKTLWDPLNRMNPGRIVSPYSRTEHLRLGEGFKPAKPPTAFAFSEDGGSFGHASMRCVGVGQCRRKEGGVMCPSYMVTREEMHSTRGRSHLLFEMMHGALKEEGWRSEAVHEALDLCLSCKGCKRDCPVNVDMATYKAEFQHHYYKGRLRPREAYSMGLIFWWSRLASLFPGLSNLILQTPALAGMVKAIGGIAPERAMPCYAAQTFRQRWKRRAARNAHCPPVILFVDTFTNHFHTDVAMATAEVLEDAGFRVVVPRRPLCCGRPLYAWGMLDLARRNLRQVMDELAPLIEDGAAIVGPEPACLSALHDELPDLFPDDERAARIAERTRTLADFLIRRGYAPPVLERRALLHLHCHHHAVFGYAHDEDLLDAMRLDWHKLDSGCCGMAGSFGFEKSHYGVAMQAGERVLLPAVRQADDSTLIISDGFSCREQIAGATGRQALHSAQVLRMALHNRDI